jgi:hypothetical protein
MLCFQASIFFSAYLMIDAIAYYFLGWFQHSYLTIQTMLQFLSKLLHLNSWYLNLAPSLFCFKVVVLQWHYTLVVLSHWNFLTGQINLMDCPQQLLVRWVMSSSLFQSSLQSTQCNLVKLPAFVNLVI